MELQKILFLQKIGIQTPEKSMQLYNSYLTLRGKYEFNRSDYFLGLPEAERKYRYYELPETVSIWLCNDSILRTKDIYKDVWSTYSEYEVKLGNALPISQKNRYIKICA